MHSHLIQTQCVLQSLEMNSSAIEAFAHLSFEAMGCRFEMMIDIDRSPHSRSDGRAIAEEMREIVLDWHDRLSVFNHNSIISHLNTTPVGTPFQLDPDLYSLCKLTEQLRIRTQGMFNIAAGSLMYAHGFRGDNHECQDLNTLDLSEAITLNNHDQTITRNHEAVSLDFGAVAKGFVIDLIREELNGYGIHNAFIHGGTSSAAGMGNKQPGSLWIVQTGEHAEVSLSDFSMGVSVRNSRTVNLRNEIYGHVMDPSTNAPARSTIELAACIHKQAAVADVYSTACTIRPELISHLSDKDCSIIAYPSDASLDSPKPIIHDPLGVIQIQKKATR